VIKKELVKKFTLWRKLNGEPRHHNSCKVCKHYSACMLTKGKSTDNEEIYKKIPDKWSLLIKNELSDTLQHFGYCLGFLDDLKHRPRQKTK
jgi:hypothetical protein